MVLTWHLFWVSDVGLARQAVCWCQPLLHRNSVHQLRGHGAAPDLIEPQAFSGPLTAYYTDSTTPTPPWHRPSPLTAIIWPLCPRVPPTADPECLRASPRVRYHHLFFCLPSLEGKVKCHSMQHIVYNVDFRDSDETNSQVSVGLLTASIVLSNDSVFSLVVSYVVFFLK